MEISIIEKQVPQLSVTDSVFFFFRILLLITSLHVFYIV